ncbi:MAG: hypothetical protein HYV09_16845 [Deltaproteobacteria bacterium]|nr:hypothetical protein [Deltaproteobacteria bacterium]
MPSKFRPLVVAAIPLVMLAAAGDAGAKAAKKKLPVIGVVTEGIAERLHHPKGKKAKKAVKNEVGKTFTALCDGSVGSWKVSELGDDGAWVGGFVNGYKPKRCLLLDAPSEPGMAAKGRPSAKTEQINSAKAAAVVALTPKKGDAPLKVDLAVFHDGEGFVAVASTSRPAGEKSSCLDLTSLVILSEGEDGKWKEIFRPTAKTKGTCGYQFFTRGDVDADGRDEIALRVDMTDGYGYRVLKRAKKGYDVVVK